MKVSELIEELRKFDQDLEVCFECADADYRQYWVESVVEESSQEKEVTNSCIVLKDYRSLK